MDALSGFEFARSRPFRFDAPYHDRYDMDSFLGRCLFYADAAAPDHMLVSAAEVQAARDALRDARRGPPGSGPSDEALWGHARTCYAKETVEGGLIPPPCRMGGWAAFGSLPVSCLILTARLRPESTFLFACGHWLNQSHIASVTYFNRPPGKAAAPETLLVAYVGAIAAAVGGVVSWKSAMRRFPVLQRAGLFAPYPAAAAANVASTYMMRNQELADGIPVFDASGQDVGYSKIAAKDAISQTLVTRVVLPAGNFILTPLVYVSLEKATPLGAVVRRRPYLALPCQILTTIACFAVSVPASLSLYPPVAKVPAAALEPHIAAKVPDGTILRYNKGT